MHGQGSPAALPQRITDNPYPGCRFWSTLSTQDKYTPPRSGRSRWISARVRAQIIIAGGMLKPGTSGRLGVKEVTRQKVGEPWE